MSQMPHFGHTLNAVLYYFFDFLESNFTLFPHFGHTLGNAVNLSRHPDKVLIFGR